MDDPFLDFEWPVAPEYEWRDWLNEKTDRPIVVSNRGLVTLESPSGVELAWEKWRKTGRNTGPVLVPTRGSDSGSWTSYRPMRRQYAALFQEFAALDYRDREAIRAFAKTYGMLSLERQCQVLPATKRRPQHYVEGESYLAWAREICVMKEALRLGRRRKGRPNDRDDLDRLSWLFASHLQHVQGRMTYDPDPDVPPRFSIAPLTLLAAMWLQHALAMAGDKQFVACKFCRRLMEISTDETGFRTHREFCSDSCKTKDYRKRMRTALTLAEKGLSTDAIAQRTVTQVATVRGWLARLDGRRRRPGRRGARLQPS
jgi:hypothetical protein